MINYLKSLKDKTRLKTDPENTFTDPAFFYPHEIINECRDNVAEALNFASLTHKSKDFARSPNLNEHLSYNLTDDKGNLIFKVYDDNAKSFPVISPQDLIKEYSDIIDALYRTLLMEDDFFNRNILPYIKRAASVCLSLPASAGFHDAKPGGLFRHSLCTAFESISRYFNHYNTNDALEKRNLKCALFLAGLYHDIAKVITDFSIYNNNNDYFNPHLETLHHFCLRTKATNLIVYFNKSRSGNHDELHLIGLFLLTAGLPQIFSYVNAEIVLNDFYLRKHDIFKSVLMSDRKCTKASAADADPYSLTITTYLIGLLFNLLSNSTYEELFTKGIFVVPYGVLIAYDSKVLNDLNTNAKDHYKKESPEKQQSWLHLSRHWSQQGYILTNGKYKVYAWHKVISKNAKYFVYGLTVKFNVKGLHNFKKLLSNAVPLGETPSLIDDMLKNYGKNFPGILEINNDKLKVTDNLKIYDQENDKEEILITTIFGEGIKEREENAQSDKALKAQIFAQEKEQGILDANEILRKNDFALNSAFASENFQTSKLSGTATNPIFNEDDEESSSMFSLPENLTEDEAEDGRIDLAAQIPTNITKQNDFKDFYEKDLKKTIPIKSDLLLKDEKSPYKTTINFPKAPKVTSSSISLKLESWLTDYNSKLVKPLNPNDLENNQEE